MNRKMDERLPQVVEDRLQEAYEAIRKGEIKQMKSMVKYKNRHRRWVSVAAALIILVSVPSVVFAAVTYFQKSEHRREDQITYEFVLNYELVPGEYQITAGYLPDGMQDRGDGKYRGENNAWITVMPIYTMAELEKANGEIVVNDIDQVEHTVINGMAADVITFKEAEKQQADTHLFLFNETEGYVLNIIAGHDVDREELIQFADNLNVERTGDGSYETAEEKAQREKAEDDAAQLAAEGAMNQDALIQLGIPQEKVYAVGEELRTYQGAYGYTVTGYEFLDSIEGYAQENFFDYTRFDGWLNEDKTLRPYTRQHYSNGTLLSEEKTEQKILSVDVDVHCYEQQAGEVPLDFNLEYVDQKPDGVYTWKKDYYSPVPAENYYLQMDDSAVYIDKAVHTQGEDRKDFFFHDMKSGETLSYTLLFVIDADRTDDFLLYPSGSNYSLWQYESTTAKEIREQLEGYIQLQ